MLRALLIAVACLALGACSGWVSDERFLGESDWERVELSGPYILQATFSDKPPTHMILATRPSGLIEGTSTNAATGQVETRLFGLVPIPGGSGDFFVLAEQSASEEEGDEFYMARLIDGRGLYIFLPDCDATPNIEGMTREPRGGFMPAEQPLDESDEPYVDDAAAAANEVDDDDRGTIVCKFSNKKALVAAGLEAEDFLSSPHIVSPLPIMILAPEEEDEEAVTDY